MIKKIFKTRNIPTLFIIIIGIASLFIKDRDIINSLITTLISILALDIFLERIGILDKIYERLIESKQPEKITLLSRDKNMTQFREFISESKEVMIIGIDLGFLAVSELQTIKSAIAKGTKFKILLVNPSVQGHYKTIVNSHDERNVYGKQVVHDHFSNAKKTIEKLQSINVNDSIEIRYRVDIPNPTLTFCDPTKRYGKMRLALKAYKDNQTTVPFFE